MSEDMQNDYEVGDVIALVEEGEDDSATRDFRIMYILEVEDRNYLVLVPVDQEDDEEYEVHFLRYDGSDILEPIEDDAEWDAVEATFETLIDELESEEN
ncbi:DUF1292 domain-containing protein [Brevibacillus sp. 7WMA2]|uniref:DUF1292 domain-containing protein n=1 Tax=Brevibacillus laterosporus LMG 15441 TaxID=1042163 RepID=A0A075QZ81_BRELA|nr:MULTISPECIES: DUF1292 domain-containing protein [Brevibacillus]HAS00568.1 DUF1292 domain-containing protein [Brevibacillus sp.]AIG25652.1 hypothetical protein BRLA_c013120 [Brevibacillus laterosporus LMG 15441]AUM64204.1 DUF1292 domain-containing protein [Brevibacillus laterosporus]AYK07187.1 DUF1292 domain-containing protein [Brevibacillus laterosporus]ERM17434.1 hypothetical protein P615_20205 [Brevibacillus laterosporus PE36]